MPAGQWRCASGSIAGTAHSTRSSTRNGMPRRSDGSICDRRMSMTGTPWRRLSCTQPTALSTGPAASHVSHEGHAPRSATRDTTDSTTADPTMASSANSEAALEAKGIRVGTTPTETAGLVARGAITKGDVLAVARVAGIQAAKQTSNLLPLCHPLLVGSVYVNFRIEDAHVEIEAKKASKK